MNIKYQIVQDEKGLFYFHVVDAETSDILMTSEPRPTKGECKDLALSARRNALLGIIEPKRFLLKVWFEFRSFAELLATSKKFSSKEEMQKVIDVLRDKGTFAPIEELAE